MSARLRCAIYTRKSTEEGLEQNFNSLHAQREACEAYVLSQAGEGWIPIKTAYDDGGFSGGSMERPALKALLADIAKGLVDIVVVYKVDRLTRSLADFAKIVEIFDARSVSFVSVTQAFNTTTSMGRLTLNVLLSFAQFEREVTGERIRDKIAASKAKGLRMGGRPPLGYDIKAGRLAPNPDEVGRVTAIFERYLEVGNVRELAKEGVRGKQWVNKAGEVMGGGLMHPAPIHHLLRNPVYRGATRHKEKLYPDTHPAIVPEELWDRVQQRLDAGNARQPKTKLVAEAASLAGRVFDDRGGAMIPIHTTRGSQRYRYYVSRPTLKGEGEAGSLGRISAGVLEGFLDEQLSPRLSPAWLNEEDPRGRWSRTIKRVTLSDSHMDVAVIEVAYTPGAFEGLQCHGRDGGELTVRLPYFKRKRQGAVLIEAAGHPRTPPAQVDRALVRAVVLAKSWAADLESGRQPSIKALARENGLCHHYTTRLLPLAYLAPDLVEMILKGAQPRDLTLARLTGATMPVLWAEQRANVRGGADGRQRP